MPGGVSEHRPLIAPAIGQLLPADRSYGLMAKFRVVQPELEALPPGADSIEVPQTWPLVLVVGAAGSGLAPA